MRSILKKYLPYLAIVAFFLLVAAIYCYPVLEGKIIVAADYIHPRSALQEGLEYHETTGDRTWWTGSMFSGMPNYQIGGGQTFSEKTFAPILDTFRIADDNQVLILFFYFISFFLLMRSFGVNKWWSIAGAFAVAFSSYFFVIIAASHNAKCIAITWMTTMIVGMMLIFRKRYVGGAIVITLSILIGFMRHPQMSYYIILLTGLLLLAEFYNHVKEKRLKDFAVATMILLVAFAVGMGAKSGRVSINSEYITQTMRGGHSDLEKEADSHNKTKGLDLSYATQWSYGIDETMTFLIPNYMGGASGFDVGTDSHLYKELTGKGVSPRDAKQFCSGAPTYWGDQPFTAGPVYMGAIVCFLFVLGLFLVKGAYKWALLAATLFSVVLSWGYHFMPFTKLFFDYFPMYNKFRAVSSILIVAEIAIPLLGFLAIKTISDKKISKEKILKNIYLSAGITAGICLFFGLFGKSFISFTSRHDAQFISQVPDWVYQAIIAQRASMMQSDAFRSFFFILLGAGVIWFYAKDKLQTKWAALIIGVLILGDMWVVNQRFLNADCFVSETVKRQAFAMKPYEKQLLQDTTYFRIVDLTTSTFSDARPSYYLKSIGGNNAAKLRRYQDLIDQHISKNNMGVLDMLNTKYFIVKTSDGNVVPHQNPNAMGNAWFVDSVLVVNTPNEESDALNVINIRNTAVLDTTFASFVKDFVPRENSSAKVEFLSYKPNELKYKTTSEQDGIVVFSEIYYPFGWHAYIDGNPTEIFRVNYTLRALNVPAGEHNIRFVFDPENLKNGDRIALTCVIIIFLTTLGYASYKLYRVIKKA